MPRTQIDQLKEIFKNEANTGNHGVFFSHEYLHTTICKYERTNFFGATTGAFLRSDWCESYRKDMSKVIKELWRENIVISKHREYDEEINNYVSGYRLAKRHEHFKLALEKLQRAASSHHSSLQIVRATGSAYPNTVSGIQINQSRATCETSLGMTGTSLAINARTLADANTRVLDAIRRSRRRYSMAS